MLNYLALWCDPKNWERIFRAPLENLQRTFREPQRTYPQNLREPSENLQRISENLQRTSREPSENLFFSFLVAENLQITHAGISRDILGILRDGRGRARASNLYQASKNPFRQCLVGEDVFCGWSRGRERLITTRLGWNNIHWKYSNQTPKHRNDWKWSNIHKSV